ncbi:hypothetical protein ACFQ4C_24460 [Larkinella insperata]|uniref:YD repeat-containing protein n=1 Tax=Larkinella insperata TaxID=332158 RepID=A0ABW3QA08_9BACT|nr:hypothetical protein [Larkinella insperata]
MKATNPVLLLIFSSGLLAGCDPGRTEETARQSACRIQKIVATAQSDVSSQQEETSFTYNADGNLTQKAFKRNLSYQNGIGNQLYTVTDTYTYDANGFLTAAASQTSEQTTRPNNSVLSQQRSSATTYLYTDGRLTGYETRDQNPYGVVTRSTVVLKYDEKGELVTKIDTRTPEIVPADAPEKPSGPVQSTWTYKSGQVIDYFEKNGTTESHPWTLQDGLVTKMVLPGGYTQQNTYDNQQRVTKNEEFVNNQLTGYYTHEWSNAKPATSTLPAFKGHPVVRPEFGVAGVMNTYNSYAINSQTNAAQHVSEKTGAPVANAQGLVESTTGEIRLLPTAARPQRTALTETYTYSNCQ